jgi:hypothetical protein
MRVFEWSDGAETGASVASESLGLAVWALLRRRTATWIICTFGLIGTLGGCGQHDRSNRMAIFGAVVLATGEKLSGSITLMPAKGYTGPAATTAIVDGQYRFDTTNGPTAGPHQVIIKRKMLTGMPRVPSANQKGAVRPDAAVESKSQWILDVDVKPAELNQHDFKLDQ